MILIFDWPVVLQVWRNSRSQNVHWFESETKVQYFKDCCQAIILKPETGLYNADLQTFIVYTNLCSQLIASMIDFQQLSRFDAYRFVTP
jgi:hypothetical protein